MPLCDYVFGTTVLENVRRRFKQHYENDNPLLYDYQDVQNVLEDDWWIKRCINDKEGNENDALQQLINAMKWRKHYDFRNIQRNYFPEEIYRLGAIFQYGNDNEGSPCLYIRLKLVKKCDEIQELMKKFLAYYINIIDEQAWGEGWVLIVDFAGIGMQNVDFELTKFLVHSLKTYFPSGISYAICVDFPWVLRAFLNAIKSLIPANRRHLVKFTSKSETRNYIHETLMPDFMGGHCKQPYKGWEVVPYGCPKFIDFCRYQLGLPIKSCQKVKSIYEPMLE